MQKEFLADFGERPMCQMPKCALLELGYTQWVLCWIHCNSKRHDPKTFFFLERLGDFSLNEFLISSFHLVKWTENIIKGKLMSFLTFSALFLIFLSKNRFSSRLTPSSLQAQSPTICICIYMGYMQYVHSRM